MPLEASAGKIELQIILREAQEAVTTLKKIQSEVYSLARTLGIAEKELDFVEKGFKRFRLAAENFFKLLRAEFRWIAGFKILAGIQDSVSAFTNTVVELNSALTKVSAQALASQSDLLLLRKAILETARTTQYSIKEIGNLATYLARAGIPSAQISQLLEPISQMAQITEENLTDLGNLIISILSTYNLNASKTYDIINLMTTALNQSKLDLQDVIIAWRYVASAVATTGDSLTDILSIMMVLKDVAGMTGSTIGTSIRQVYTYLQQMPAKFKNYLINVLGFTDEDFKKIDVRTHSLIEVLDYLAKKGFTAASAFQVFGTRGASAFALLLKNLELIKKYREELLKLREQGQFWEAYSRSLDSIEMRWKILINNLKTYSETLEKSFKLATIEITSAILSLSNTISIGLNKKIMEIAGALGTLLVARKFIEPVKDIFTTFINILRRVPTSIEEISKSFGSLDAILTKVGRGGVIGAILGLVSALIPAEGSFRKLKIAIDSVLVVLSAISITAQPVIGTLLTLVNVINLIRDLNAPADRFEKTIKRMTDSLSSLSNVMNLLQAPSKQISLMLTRFPQVYKKQFEELKQIIKESKIPETVKKEIIDSIDRMLSVPSTRNVERFKNTINQNIKTVINSLRGNIVNVENEIINEMVRNLRRNTPEILKNFADTRLAVLKYLYEQGLYQPSDRLELQLLERARKLPEKLVKYIHPYIRKLQILEDLEKAYDDYLKQLNKISGEEGIITKKIDEQNKVRERQIINITRYSNFLDKLRQFNREWQNLFSTSPENIKQVNQLINLYRKIDNYYTNFVEKFKSQLTPAQRKQIDNLTKLDLKYNKLINTIKKFLNTHGILPRQIISLEGALRKAGLSIDLFSNEIVKSITLTIDKATNLKIINSIIKSLINNYSLFTDKLNLSKEQINSIFEEIIRKTTQLYSEGQISFNAFRKVIINLANIKQFGIENTIRTLIENLSKLSFTNFKDIIRIFSLLKDDLKDTKDAFQFLNEETKKFIDTAQSLTQFKEIMSDIQNAIVEFGLSGKEANEIYMKLINKSRELYEQNKITSTQFKGLVDNILQLRMQNIMAQFGTFGNQFQQVFNFIQSNAEQIKTTFESLSDPIKGNRQELTGFMQDFQRLNMVLIQGLEQGKISLSEYIQLMLGLGKVGEQAIQQMEQNISGAQRVWISLKEGAQSFANEYLNTAQVIADATRQIFDALANQITNVLMDMITGKLKTFKEYAYAILSTILRIVIEMSVRIAMAKAIAYAMGEGGILPGTFIPIKKFATGGIATQPTIGIIAEKGQPEAVVPLPDGRNIPVKIVNENKTNNQNVFDKMELARIIHNASISAFVEASNSILPLVYNLPNAEQQFYNFLYENKDKIKRLLEK